jgi:hypothetical protein
VFIRVDPWLNASWFGFGVRNLRPRPDLSGELAP